MKKIIVSLSMIAAVAAIAVGATTAFFSDTETSTGNTFTAGAIDLKVDSMCHYYNLVGYDANNQPQYQDVGCGEVDGQSHVGTGQWSETDLKNGVHRFFWFNDIKPGDWGEDTISLHVYTNDAWGRVKMNLTNDLDNSCTEPEQGTNGEGCTVASPETTPGAGELLEAMLPGFSMWLDQGLIPGFQCNNPADPTTAGAKCPADPTEGDNIWQPYEGQSWQLSANHPFSGDLMSAYNAANTPVACASADGHDNYGRCHGLAADGRMVGSVTYYFGLNWSLPLTTGNEVQTDSLSGDISFEIQQHRNNPNPVW